MLGCGEPRAGENLPTAAFVSASRVNPGDLVRFDGTFSRDDGLIQSYSYDFGDASEVLVSFSPQAEHVFREETRYIVTLTVEDDLGNLGSVFHYVQVTADDVGCVEDLDCLDEESHCVVGRCYIRPPAL